MGGRWPYLAPAGVEVTRPDRLTVGVLVTACNVAEHLPQALASIAAQTRAPEQVVVCDDASDDDVAAAVAPFADRVELVRRAVRGGEGAAKNTALAALVTDLVVVLDGDDTMSPHRLEAVAQVAEVRPDLAIVTTAWEEFGPAADGSWSLADHFPVQDQRTQILRWNFLPAPALRRRELLAAGGFAEDLRYGPDWECYARMFLRGARAGLVPSPLYGYRRWNGQQTADRDRVLRGRVEVVRRIAAQDLLTDADRRTLRGTLAGARYDRWVARLPQADRREAAALLTGAGTSVRRRVLAGAGLIHPPLAAVLAQRVAPGRRVGAR
ncbi:glycosyltransferase family 2 protein [Kineococcus aurantiacus]|uniref:glycosyltransferase family 2 protein n=1 Tax=Kineococcus aurantiacus TaxID=37633 RepID=UPI001C535DA4